jgi:ParB family chromosome partitioning protein
MAGRRIALSSLAADPVEEIPGHGAGTPIRLAPDRIAPTPLNKRTNFGTPDELTELGESIRHRQLAAVVVVTRSRYLSLFPEHQDRIGTADYVLVNGERRWRAASQVKLPRLDATIREDFDSRTDLITSVAAENLDRLNLDPIEEAHSVEELVAECGSAAAAAKELHRTEGWVSQRRALLKLTPELQARVQAGEIPVRIARSIASVPPGEQEAALNDAVGRQAAKKQARRREAAGREPGGQHPDATAAAPQPAVAAPAGPAPEPAGPGPAATAPPANRPAARSGGTEATGTGSGADLPWGSPATLAELIRSRLTAENLAELLRLLAA